jgi:predicted transposase/invertase (TIGR01784 family)
MRRDTIFFQLFRQSPTLLFDLLTNPPANPTEYTFDSVEVKETSFRIDGVFLPPNPTGNIYFCEVQFQPDRLLYERLLSEIGIYVYRQRELFHDWRAVVIYPTRTVEQARREIVNDIITSGRVSVVYLDELGTVGELPIGVGLMVLTTLDNNTAVETSRLLIQQLQNVPNGTAIINLISTIIVYKFQNLSRAEVDVMLGIELQQTRVYQEARAEGLQVGLAEGRQEGRQEGESELVLRLLTRRVGNLSASVRSQIKALPLVQVEELAEALLDFTQMSDLVVWLDKSIG